MAAAGNRTPFDMVGGSSVVHAIANRFYDLVDDDPRYAGLRALHGQDLSSIRHGLELFLTGWLGGPRDWFDRGQCIVSLHNAFPITPELAQQWSDAMTRAIEAQDGMDREIAGLMAEKLGHMALGMVNIGAAKAA